MNDHVYNGMRQVSQVWLPLVGALYFGLGQFWGFPKIEEVIGSITVLDTALGTAVLALRRQYNKSDAGYGGDLNIREGEDSVQLELDVSKNPEALAKKDEVTFKVNREQVP